MHLLKFNFFHYHLRSNRMESFPSQIENRLVNKLLIDLFDTFQSKLNFSVFLGDVEVQFFWTILDLRISVWTDQSNMSITRESLFLEKPVSSKPFALNDLGGFMVHATAHWNVFICIIIKPFAVPFNSIWRKSNN